MPQTDVPLRSVQASGWRPCPTCRIRAIGKKSPLNASIPETAIPCRPVDVSPNIDSVQSINVM